MSGLERIDAGRLGSEPKARPRDLFYGPTALNLPSIATAPPDASPFGCWPWQWPASP